jgi:alkanesulfonate monooxygenase SsuD/methylene tetrahydromethanopterin reductase-like flavin-dependent oxidoreductase (luciferase family)
MEAWTTLTWLAAKFPNVLLCHHVLGQGYRNPALTAKMAATLQMLSGNRFILGIGAGWRDDEYKAYGYEFPRPAVRFAELEELIQICRLMWTQDAPTFTGKHFHITEAAAPPKPEIVPPVCIGAYGEQIGLPMVGRLADMWNASTLGNVDRWLVKRDIVRASAEKSGRNPSDIQISLTVEKPLPNTDEESEMLRTQLQVMADHGVEHFVMDFGHPQSTEPVLRFVEQVMQPMKAARK